MKRVIAVFLVLAALFSLCTAASAAEPFGWVSVYTMTEPDEPNSRVNMQTIDGVNYLFLPEGYHVDNLTLYFSCTVPTQLFSIRGPLKAGAIQSGEAFNLRDYCGELSQYNVTLTARSGASVSELKLTILPTGGVASLFLVSEDPENQGREWVEASPDKSNKAKGSMLLLSPDGTTVYDGALTQIKGRGNSTWLADKKPYQIKLKDKTDLLQTQEPSNAKKAWVLLTNHTDDALLRNQITYDLSVAMGMEPGIECRPVDLFYDGEYRGSYLLCEKVEVNSGRVDIADLEEANEEANPETDLEELEVATGTTANGAHYTFCAGMQNPENITGGYLLEMETAYRAANEICYFVTTRNNYVVVKSPECASQAQMDYIASYYQDFEDTVYNGGVHPTNGKRIDDYADVTSLAQCYLVNELTKNPDGYRTSAYLYKDADSNTIIAGPVWDYDLSFGHSWGQYVNACADPKEFFTLHSAFGRALYYIPSFRQAVHDIYFDTLEPLLTETLLNGRVENAALDSFSGYERELAASAYGNALVWGFGAQSWQNGCDSLLLYIMTRQEWLSSAFATWNAETAEMLSGYIDVQNTDWFYEAVAKATDYGILNGMSNGIFAPEQQTTRAQSAKVLFAISGAREPEFRPVFTDVFSHDWFCPAVLWAQENGIVLGQGDGTFAPEENITREDFVVLLYRFLGSPDAGGDCLAAFPDSAKIDAYAVKAMQWAVNAGLIKGYAEDGTLRPLANITRAELATLIVRFYDGFIHR